MVSFSSLSPINSVNVTSSSALSQGSEQQTSQKVSPSNQSLTANLISNVDTLNLSSNSQQKASTKESEKNESVSVSSSTGRSQSSSGMSSEEAMSLYRKVAQFL